MIGPCYALLCFARNTLTHFVIVHGHTNAAAALHSFPHCLLVVHMYTATAAAQLVAAVQGLATRSLTLQS